MKATRWIAGASWFLAALGCAQILGFEDHELGSIDGTGASGAADSGTGALGGGGGGPPSGGGSSAVGGMGGMGGSDGGSGGSGQGGTGGGTGGAPSGGTAGAGGAGSGGDAGTGGGGSGGTCSSLCLAGAALVHRYSFDGDGTEVTDSIGSAHGVLVGTTLSGSGDAALSGTDQYVDLPNGIVSALGDATFEAWVTWAGTGAWQRIFDFGSESEGVEDMQGSGEHYLFLTPRAVNASGTLRAVYTTSGVSGEVVINGSSGLASNELSQIVVVIDGSTLHLYRNGVVEGFAGPIGPLSALNDINNWLGRSQYANDSELAGTFHEFRIYDEALTAEQIADLFAAGPDASFPSPE